MPKTDADHLTEQQKKWFASVREGLERDTGKSLSEWAEIARTCPETRHRARLAWFKQTHGLMQNRASMVLNEAFPSPDAGWSEPEALRDALWYEPAQQAIFDAVEAQVMRLPKVIVGQRKGYSAWSNAFQFAALRPVRKAEAALGLALAPEDASGLQPSRNDGWSERLKSRLPLASPADVTPALEALLRAAWERS
jgi:hypothetical protein